jgi:hypothetical protein
MGSCMSQPHHPPLHERLDEYDDKQFSRIQHRNWFESRPGWWRKYRFGEDTTSSSMNDDIMYWGRIDTRTHMLPLRSDEASPTSTETTATISYASPRSYFHESNPSSIISAVPMTKRDFLDDGQVAAGWKVKRRGQALKLRLAKHRSLQMAVSRQPSFFAQEGEDLVSLISWDSSFFTPSFHSRRERFTSSNTRESLPFLTEPKAAYNSVNGVVWKEISRDNVVTAIAMTRLPSRSSFSNPLLLALGDENGIVVVSKINDDDLFTSDNRESGKAHLHEDALDISIEGRVRSIDFGKHQSIVVGGDGKSCSGPHTVMRFLP